MAEPDRIEPVLCPVGACGGAGRGRRAVPPGCSARRHARRRHRRSQRGAARGAGAGREGRADRCDGADHAARPAPARSWSRARIHDDSAARATGPFVKVNCAAIPDGAARERAVRPREGRVHRRGRQRKPGASSWPTAARCSSTRSASMPLEMQVKLLRVLQEREFERVGGSRDHPRRRARGRGDQPRPRRRWSRAGSSARISTTASTSSRSRCRRCASAREDIPLLVGTSSRSFARQAGKRIETSRAERCERAHRATPGRATSASWRT